MEEELLEFLIENEFVFSGKTDQELRETEEFNILTQLLEGSKAIREIESKKSVKMILFSLSADGLVIIEDDTVELSPRVHAMIGS